jgi:ketosteroid isomerase-like protein
VRRALDAWNRGDIDGLVALCHPGIRFRSLIAAAEGDKAHRGHQGVRDWWGQVEEVFAERRMEVDEIRSRGRWTVVTGCGYGKGRASGADVRWPFVSVVEPVDGLLSTWRFFTDAGEAEAFMGEG